MGTMAGALESPQNNPVHRCCIRTAIACKLAQDMTNWIPVVIGNCKQMHSQKKKCTVGAGQTTQRLCSENFDTCLLLVGQVCWPNEAIQAVFDPN